MKKILSLTCALLLIVSLYAQNAQPAPVQFQLVVDRDIKMFMDTGRMSSFFNNKNRGSQTASVAQPYKAIVVLADGTNADSICVKAGNNSTKDDLFKLSFSLRTDNPKIERTGNILKIKLGGYILPASYTAIVTIKNGNGLESQPKMIIK